jgi:hypothetical protein
MDWLQTKRCISYTPLYSTLFFKHEIKEKKEREMFSWLKRLRNKEDNEEKKETLDIEYMVLPDIDDRLPNHSVQVYNHIHQLLKDPHQEQQTENQQLIFGPHTTTATFTSLPDRKQQACFLFCTFIHSDLPPTNNTMTMWGHHVFEKQWIMYMDCGHQVVIPKFNGVHLNHTCKQCTPYRYRFASWDRQHALTKNGPLLMDKYKTKADRIVYLYQLSVHRMKD